MILALVEVEKNIKIAVGKINKAPDEVRAIVLTSFGCNLPI